jgi:hypothetical protein
MTLTNGSIVVSGTTDDAGSFAYAVESAVTQPDDGRDVWDDDSATTDKLGASTDGCDVRLHGVLDRKQYSTWRFYIGDGAQPAAGTAQETAQAAGSAALAWYDEQSPCFDADQSSVPAMQLLGTGDSRESDLTTDGSQSRCVPRSGIDSVSTIDSGNLDPSSVTAATCTWTDSHSYPDEIVQADVRFNTADKDFTYHPAASNCYYDYDVQGVLTHEFGHVLGFDDVEDYAARYETMYGFIYSCRKLYRSLARGDVLAARQYY